MEDSAVEKSGHAEAMTPRRRILSVLEGKKPDRVPWVPLVGRFYVRSLPELGLPIEEFAPPEKATGPALRESLNLAEIEILRYVGADIMRRHVMMWKTGYSRCTPFRREEKGVLIEGFDTPRGTIWEERKSLGGTEYISKHMIESSEDLKCYREVIADSRIRPCYDDFHEFEDYIGEDGVNTVTGPVTPLQELDEYADILHSGGLYHIAHMCGKISLLTDKIARGRFDGVDSVCPPTTGDLEPGDALRRIGKRIIGGIEPPTLVRNDEEGIIEYVEEKLSQVEEIPGGKQHFMLCTAIRPPGGPRPGICGRYRSM